MTIEKFFRWALFCAGLITAIFAGYMFYIDNIAAGAAWLAMAVGFLCFATQVKNYNFDDDDEDRDENNNSQADRELHDMAVLIADLVVMNLKNIGRTAPPGRKEIEDLENKLDNFLSLMPVNKSERDKIDEEFFRLKERKQRSESGRAFFNQLGIRK